MCLPLRAEKSPVRTKGRRSNNRLKVRNLWPPNRFLASKTISNAMTGFIITKYHELIRFFIKNLTRMSLKLEKPEKIRISFKCYFFLFFGIFRIPTACLWLPICQNIYISPISRPFHFVHHWRGNFYFIPPQGTYFNPIFPLCYVLPLTA